MIVDVTIIAVLSRLDSYDSEKLSVMRFCEYGNESSCSTEGRQWTIISRPLKSQYFCLPPEPG
jgi:hypothetical protein